jgi:alkanesulfonate monooxygenase SsuD/methylene tetrahydromethanopterin reductase-like flavin-dependent oxidoreductase (luciferase family)
MEFGFALPQYDYSVPGESPLSWSTMETWSDRAVRAGFTSLWVSDHLFLSLERYGGPSDRFGALDPIVMLASLAVRHPAVSLGCLVFCAQLRPPKILAKQLETLDHLTPGRITVGMGAGWNEAEFAEVGVPFERPGKRLQQLVEAADDVRSFLAEHERRIPVWFGGKGDRLVDLAARHADGWNTVWAWSFDEYRKKLDVVRHACDATGRDPDTLALSLGLNAIVGESEADVRRRWERISANAPSGMYDATSLDEWRTGRLVGTVEQVREQAAGWAQLGVRLLVVNVGALPFSVTDPDDLDLVASALL